MDERDKAYVDLMKIRMIHHHGIIGQYGNFNGVQLGDIVVNALMAQAHGKIVELMEDGRRLNLAEALQNLNEAIIEQRGMGPCIIALVEACAAKALHRPN